MTASTLRRSALGAALALVAGPSLSGASSAQEAAARRTVTRMIVLDCGEASAPDLSQWSPGSHQGRPITFSNNCYLIQHGRDWMLWDTGVSDDLAGLPGEVVAHDVRGLVRKGLAKQLHALGIELSKIGLIAFSHAHFDHVGNSRLFPRARWLVQRNEHAAMFAPDAAAKGFVPALYRSMKGNPVALLDGDHDVFGDGSVRIISTPGHTPGHQSLFVRLPASRPVILSGDAAHTLENFAHHRAPSFNHDPVATKASMAKLEQLARSTDAVLLINHDRVQSALVAHAPEEIR